MNEGSSCTGGGALELLHGTACCMEQSSSGRYSAILGCCYGPRPSVSALTATTIRTVPQLQRAGRLLAWVPALVEREPHI